MSDIITNSQYNRLSRTATTHPSASVRESALYDLSRLKHDGVNNLLQQIATTDTDARVREAAQQFLKQRGGSMSQAVTSTTSDASATLPSEDDILQTKSFNFSFEDAPPVASTADDADPDHWHCEQCGTLNWSYHRECKQCGAPKIQKRDSRSVTTKRQAALGRSVGQSPAAEAAPVFYSDPRHRNYVENRNKKIYGKYGGSTVGMLMLFVMLSIISLMVLYFGKMALDRYQVLRDTGVTIDGQYTSRFTDTDDDGNTEYYVTYVFEVNGQQYSHRQDVERTLYHNAERGARATILYAPSDPTISQIDGTLSSTTAIVMLGVGIILLVSDTLLVFFVLRGRKRDQLLGEEGTLVRGVVRKFSEVRTKNDRHFKVEYTFTPPDGMADIKATQNARYQKTAREMVGAGTPVWVLYRNPRHYRML